MVIDDPVEKKIEAIQQEMTERDINISAFATVLLSQVPLLGPYLDNVLKDKRQERVIERITELCRLLSEEIKRLGKTKLDLNASQSEEFQSILLTVLRSLEITEERVKLRYLKNILINSVHVESVGNPNKKLYLQLVRELSVEHIVALQRICKCPVSTVLTIGELQGMFPQWQSDNTRRICNDLARYWLLANATPVGQRYQVTRHGVEFLRFILDEGEI